jgi:hypothetical protein
MGYPLDTNQGLSSLDLDDLLPYGTRKLPLASRRDNPIP